MSVVYTVTAGYTGLGRRPAGRDLGRKSVATEGARCPACGGQACAEPALTVTRDGITTTTVPVTCKAGCWETYLHRGHERTRPLRSYLADLATTPTKEICVKLNDDDRALVERVKELKEILGLTWGAIGKACDRSYSAVTNAVRNPEQYLSAGVREALAAWVAKEAVIAKAAPSADADTCPCGGDLDTGYECNDCGKDCAPAADDIASTDTELEELADGGNFDPEPCPEVETPTLEPGSSDLDKAVLKGLEESIERMADEVNRYEWALTVVLSEVARETMREWLRMRGLEHVKTTVSACVYAVEKPSRPGYASVEGAV